MYWSIMLVQLGVLALTSIRYDPHAFISVARRSFYLCKDAAFTKVFTLNVQRVFTLTQKCLPLLRAGAAQGGKDGAVYRDPARVINVGF